jgi:hypothetical protein|tara:strand:+ start:228 stop:1112 length:885 start_codon:yes stop_codon:yes gene_type:complete
MGKFSAVTRAVTKKAKKKIKKEDPKPKFKADRKLKPEVEKELKKQDAVKRNAPKKDSGRAFQQSSAEKAADKAPKPKTDTRVAEAGGNVTKAQQDRINAAPSTQALTSLKSTLNKEVDALKTLTDGEKKRRKQKISTLVDNAKDKIRTKGEKAAKKKGTDRRSAAEKPQSSTERQAAAIGKSRTPRSGPPQSDRKAGMNMMTSYTSLSRAQGKQKAKADLSSGKITKTEHDAIIKKIDDLNLGEVSKSSRGASQRSRDKMMKSKMKPLPIPFNGGGMSSRKGNFDMRKGGMFSK